MADDIKARVARLEESIKEQCGRNPAFASVLLGCTLRAIIAEFGAKTAYALFQTTADVAAEVIIGKQNGDRTNV